MFYTKNNSLPTWYQSYGSLITEQEATVAIFSEDSDERLKQYLDSNSNFLEAIDSFYKQTGEGEIKEEYIELSPDKYKVQPGDSAYVVVDKTDKANPIITIGLENETAIIGDLDLAKAAGFVYKSMDGPGTDELEYASTLSAIHMSLAERGVSEKGIQKVFNMFDTQVFGTKYEGYTLEEWIDGDFDGRAEACAMALAKLEIPKSRIRGINWGTVITDVAMLLLAIPSLGTSLGATSVGKAAITAGSKIKNVGKIVANSKRVANATNKAKAVGNAIKSGKIMTRVTTSMSNAWKALGTAGRLSKAKAFMPVGKQVEWLSKAKNASNVQVMKYFKNSKGVNMVKLQNVGADGKLAAGAFNAGVDNLLLNAGKAGGMSMKTLTQFAPAAGLMLPVSKLETGNLEGVTGEDEQMDDMFNPYNPFELMGYYDQAKADPAKAMAQYKQVAAADLAAQLHDAMDGWTDNSDELAIALIVLSMDKITANAVKSEYESSYGAKFYDEVIASELESDMEEIVGCYWAALTGDGPYVSKVKQKLAQITA